MLATRSCALLLLVQLPSAQLTASASWADPSPVDPSPGVASVVFSLLRDSEGLNVFLERTRCLSRAMTGGPPYDEVIFHTGNLRAADFPTPWPAASALKLVDVHPYGGFVLPPQQPPPADEASVGYKHMCRFMSLVWFRALAKYEYALRVDDDVCIQRFVEHPVEAMRRRHLVFAYGLETVEKHAETLETMPPWVARFTREAKLEMPDRAVSKMYFTNFHVSRVDWWLLPEVQSYLVAVDTSRGIYAHRWGDAPIQTVALDLFAPPGTVARLGTDYLHASTMNRIFHNGTETDGWQDAEMIHHPLVSARRPRRLATGGATTCDTPCNATPPAAPPLLPAPLAPPFLLVPTSNVSGNATDTVAAWSFLISFATRHSWDYLSAKRLEQVAAALERTLFAGNGTAQAYRTLSAAGVVVEVSLSFPTEAEALTAKTSAEARLSSDADMSALLASPAVQASAAPAFTPPVRVPIAPPPAPPGPPSPPSPPSLPPLPPLSPGALLVSSRDELLGAITRPHAEHLELSLAAGTRLSLGGVSIALPRATNLTLRADDASIEAGGAQPLFLVGAASTLTLHGVTLRGGGGGGGGGGCVDVADGARLETVGCHFEECHAESGGAVAVHGVGSSVSLRNSTVSHCSAAGLGGGVYATAGTRVEVEHSVFSECEASSGGGVAADGGAAVALVHCTFAACVAQASVLATGGGVLSVGAGTAVSLVACSFLGCLTSLPASWLGGGSGLAVDIGGGASVSACNFSNCYTDGIGGGISAFRPAADGTAPAVSVSHSVFDKCLAKVYGGAIFGLRDSGVAGLVHVRSSLFFRCANAFEGGGGGGGAGAFMGVGVVNDSFVDGCDSSNDGGAFILRYGGQMLLGGVVLRNVYATSQGGGMRLLSSSELVMEGCTIDGATTLNNGAGLAVSESSLARLINCTLRDCRARSGGGAMDVWVGGVVIVSGGSELVRCGTPGQGGAIRLGDGKVTISDSRIERCFAVNGGALHVINGGEITLERSALVGCSTFDTDGDANFVSAKQVIYDEVACWAQGDGAPIFSSEGRFNVVVFRECEIRESITGANGMSVVGGTVDFIDCLLEQNAACTQGGVGNIVNGVVRFRGCVLRDNFAEGLGGGCFIMQSADATLELIDTTLDGCRVRTASASGAAVLVSGGGTLRVRNATIINSIGSVDTGLHVYAAAAATTTLDVALLTVDVCDVGTPPLAFPAETPHLTAAVRGLRAIVRHGCGTAEEARTPPAALSLHPLALPRCDSLSAPACGTAAVCKEVDVLTPAAAIVSPHCACNSSRFELPLTSALYAEHVAPYVLGCTTPRIGAGVGIAALAVSQVVLAVTKPANESRVLTLRMGGTARGNATWRVDPSSVPRWLVLDALQGEYTSADDEAEIVRVTGVTSGVVERRQAYSATLRLTVVSSASEKVFHVPVTLQLYAPDEARRGVWGDISAAQHGVEQPSCATPLAVAELLALEAEHRFYFTSCDQDSLPVGHTLPTSADERTFRATVTHVSDGTQYSPSVVPRVGGVYGVYYYARVLPFRPPVPSSSSPSTALPAHHASPTCHIRTQSLCRLPPAPHHATDAARLPSPRHSPATDLPTRSLAGEPFGRSDIRFTATCPPGLVSTPDGRRCGCRAGYVPDEENACTACPVPTSSSPGSARCDICEQGAYRVSSVEPASVQTCLDCPDEATCAVNTTLRTLSLNPFYWRLSVEARRPVRCKSYGDWSPCRGGDDPGRDGDGYCAPGYVGPRCEGCEGPAYSRYFDKWTARCEPCGDLGAYSSIAAVVCVLVLGTVAFAVQQNGSVPSYARKLRARMQLSRLHALWNKGGMRYKVKAFVGLYQCVASIPSVFNISPPTDDYLLHILNIIEFPVDIEGIVVPSSCLGDYRTRLWIGSTWPLVLLAVCTVCVLASVWWQHMRDSQSEDISSTMTAMHTAWPVGLERTLPLMVGITFLLVPSTSTRIFKTFLCDSYEYSATETRSYLHEDPLLSCQSDEYFATRNIAYGMMVVWPIGVPLFYALLLQATDRALREHRPTVLVKGAAFLSDDYHRRACWWEPIEMCRKLALTGWVLLINEQIVLLRVVVAVLICIMFFIIRLSIQPLQRTDDTFIALSVDIALTIVYITVLLIKGCDVSSEVCSSYGFGGTSAGIYIFIFFVFTAILIQLVIGITNLWITGRMPTFLLIAQAHSVPPSTILSKLLRRSLASWKRKLADALGTDVPRLSPSEAAAVLQFYSERKHPAPPGTPRALVPILAGNTADVFVEGVFPRTRCYVKFDRAVCGLRWSRRRFLSLYTVQGVTLMGAEENSSEGGDESTRAREAEAKTVGAHAEPSVSRKGELHRLHSLTSRSQLQRLGLSVKRLVSVSKAVNEVHVAYTDRGGIPRVLTLCMRTWNAARWSEGLTVLLRMLPCHVPVAHWHWTMCCMAATCAQGAAGSLRLSDVRALLRHANASGRLSAAAVEAVINSARASEKQQLAEWMVPASQHDRHRPMLHLRQVAELLLRLRVTSALAEIFEDSATIAGGKTAKLHTRIWTKSGHDEELSEATSRFGQQLTRGGEMDMQDSLDVHQFASRLLSPPNTAVAACRGVELARPLSHYWIASSHNSYILGDQICGMSTAATYKRQLLQGVRHVEIDCWDGPKKPIVTHGHTFCTAESFDRVAKAISEFAFVASEMPVILSIEMHCCVLQQNAIAKLLTEHLGDILLTHEELGRLPSPTLINLKRRVLVKGKVKVASSKKHSSAARSCVRSMRKSAWRSNMDDTPEEEDDPPSISSLQYVLEGSNTAPSLSRNSVRQSRTYSSETSSRTSSRQEISNSCYSEPFEIVERAVHQLKKRHKKSDHSGGDPFYHSCLAIRAMSISDFLAGKAPGWLLPITSFDEQRLLEALKLSRAEKNQLMGLGAQNGALFGMHHVTTVGASLSKDEAVMANAAARLANDPPITIGRMQRRTVNWLLRPYPLGLRFSGKNMSPIPGWLSGAQGVSLNFSTNDLALQCHFALFKGSGGYVLKPSGMLSGAGKLLKGWQSKWEEEDDDFWPHAQEHLQHTTLRILSLHNMPKRTEQRPRYDGTRSKCHKHAPELSGEMRPPNNLEPSIPGLVVSLFAIGGFCAVSTSLPRPSPHLKTEVVLPKLDNGMTAEVNQTVHCVAAEPDATFFRVSLTEHGREVAYETAILGRLRRGYRVFQLRGMLGTRIELSYLFVHIGFGRLPNLWIQPRHAALALRAGPRAHLRDQPTGVDEVSSTDCCGLDRST
ncbi:hypothetical protein AB1Y20_008247 [Prymnesium parvum]|uniref:Phosphoinositide phospholipase C n=1 Tax=Prymnesium parvum TaxID=97485 RepID=A0AB34IUB3_PRYPA